MTIVTPPELPARALEPAGWRTGFFTNPKTGHKIHYGCAFPQHVHPPKLVVLIAPGLSEFTQKYFETAQNMLSRGYAVWALDWQYQGLSGRLKDNPHKRHSDGFEADLSDLDMLVRDYIKPSAVHPDRGRIPIVMIGHSMGGNLGLRYLADHAGLIDAAAFSAPCLGIYNLNLWHRTLAVLLRPLLPIIGHIYARDGDWREDSRRNDGTDVFSSDPVRDSVFNAWCATNPALQIGGTTYKFVIELLKSCAVLLKPQAATRITIPVVIALAGEERIVDNAATRAFARHLPLSEIFEIEGAKHEILMEKDIYRDRFLAAFDKLIETHNIASEDRLKPF